VLGVSAGESSSNVISTVTNLVSNIKVKLNLTNGSLSNRCEVTVDDRFVGNGYGIPTVASKEAIALLARCEALLLDPTYTAKAMAGLIEYVRKEKFTESQTVLFWHTGGQVALFA
jgi:1-aminocyclopropane-1-carboxylate deaminase/D-cysteine desulfhydrase-like pyridoxal-dependent ACC family enzyme